MRKPRSSSAAEAVPRPEPERSAARATYPVPGQMFMGYRIEGVLDEGGMGVVFEATHEYSGDAVAIKCLLPALKSRNDFLKRFRQECTFYPKLKHPNIVRMRSAGVSPDSVPFIIMDRLKGKTLRNILAKVLRLDFLNAVHVMLQVADAMRFVHSKGILHLDLKPENIFVGTSGEEKGQVTLLDFGIAKWEQGGMSTDELPPVGTARYLSPERARSLCRPAESGRRAKVDRRADIYAFGVIFYEVLTGRHTFIDDLITPLSYEETLTGHLHAELVPAHMLVPMVPTSVWPLLERCLSIDLEERCPSFDEVVKELRALIHGAVPVGHLLAKRLAEEETQMARVAAFEAIAGEVDDEAEEEPDERAAEAASERAPRSAARGSGTAELVDFVPSARALPFVSSAAERGQAGRGRGFTEELRDAPLAPAPQEELAPGAGPLSEPSAAVPSGRGRGFTVKIPRDALPPPLPTAPPASSAGTLIPVARTTELPAPRPVTVPAAASAPVRAEATGASAWRLMPLLVMGSLIGLACVLSGTTLVLVLRTQVPGASGVSGAAATPPIVGATSAASAAPTLAPALLESAGAPAVRAPPEPQPAPLEPAPPEPAPPEPRGTAAEVREGAALAQAGSSPSAARTPSPSPSMEPALKPKRAPAPKKSPGRTPPKPAIAGPLIDFDDAPAPKSQGRR